jgi:Spy/CpxP family protein refolding chaperone
MMALNRWMYRLASGLSLLGSAALSGCAAGAASAPVPATAVSSLAADDDLIADLVVHHRHHHQGGATMFVALSLDTLGLPREQQAVVTQIQSVLFTKMEPARLREQSVLTALADGLAAGAIDKAKVDAAIAELETASGLLHQATVDALQELHAALTPVQRAALADKIVANWAVFRQANAEDEQVGTDRRVSHLADLTGKLGLSADQVETIRATFHATMLPAEARAPAEIDAYLERLGSFRRDTFDPATIEGGAAANAHIAARGAARMARFYEAVDPVLTPAQRTQLVLLLRDHATHKDDAELAAH